jgi:hypothetical protein
MSAIFTKEYEKESTQAKRAAPHMGGRRVVIRGLDDSIVDDILPD